MDLKKKIMIAAVSLVVLALVIFTAYQVIVYVKGSGDTDYIAAEDTAEQEDSATAEETEASDDTEQEYSSPAEMAEAMGSTEQLYSSPAEEAAALYGSEQIYSSPAEEAAAEAFAEGNAGHVFNPKDVPDDIHGLFADDPATTELEFIQAVNYYIKNSDEDMFDIYSSGPGEEFVLNANENIGTNMGYLEQYLISEETSGVQTVKLILHRNDEAYVYRHRVFGVPLPEGNSEAAELDKAVEKIMGDILTPQMSDYQIELAVHDFLIEKCHYSKSDDAPVLHSAYGALVNRNAVCQGYASAFELILNIAGVECIFVTGTSGMQHGWNMVNLGGAWHHVDVTWDDPSNTGGNGYDMTSHTFFNVSDDVMDDDHIWDEEFYPECYSMRENYYYKNGLLFEDISEFERYLGEVVDAGNKADVEYAVMDYEYNRYDIQSIVGGLGYYGSYAYRITRGYDNVVDGYNVIRIKLK